MNILKHCSLILLVLIYFSSCSGEDSPEEEQKTEEDLPITLEGDYLGTWNSSTDMDIIYTAYAISAKLTFANDEKTRLTGEFFATPSFRSCCQSAGNDGTMLIDLDGDTITSFSFDDQIVGCNGIFSGTGSITSKTPYTLQIDFTGNDCDGNHIGQIVFTRRNN